MFSKIMMIALLVAVAAAATATNPSLTTLTNNDINAMRYAITLENLEATFYNMMQARFTPADFANANLPGVTAGTYTIFGMIQGHENAHVAFINQTLRNLGITAPVPCTYNFQSVTSVQTYIQLAAIFENTGVSAYDGAINTVFNATVVQALATVATIEGRHASWLNGLSMGMPIYPANTTNDPAATPQTVGQAIAPYLNCPYNVTATFPMLYTVVPVTNTTDPSIYAVTTNDINALNYALFLENLEAAFYAAGQARFNASNFTAAGYSASVYSNLNLIAAHETAHAAALTAAVNGVRPGAAVPPCTYDFSAVQTSVAQYLATAATLENTGVTAYDGAINTIYNSAFKQVAATIATVEARHSSYLYNVTQGTPIPINNFDTANPPASIVQAVTQLGLIVSCPNNFQASLPLPVVYQLGAFQNATGGATTRPATGTTTTTTTTGSNTNGASIAAPVAAFVVFASAIAALL